MNETLNYIERKVHRLVPTGMRNKSINSNSLKQKKCIFQQITIHYRYSWLADSSFMAVQGVPRPFILEFHYPLGFINYYT
jgi:hypothetical protein